MDKIPESVLEAVRQAATDGRLGCADAHTLANKLEVELNLIGRAANELKIKIKNCQLGCF